MSSLQFPGKYLALPSVLFPGLGDPPEHKEILTFQYEVSVTDEHLDAPHSLEDSPKPTNFFQERLFRYN